MQGRYGSRILLCRVAQRPGARATMKNWPACTVRATPLPILRCSSGARTTGYASGSDALGCFPRARRLPLPRPNIIGLQCDYMIKENIREIKENFSAFVERAERGAIVIVCRRNEPIAELRALPRKRTARVLGSPVQGLHVSKSLLRTAIARDRSAVFRGRCLNILLETVTFLWVMEDSIELSAAARGALQDSENIVHLSGVRVGDIGQARDWKTRVTAVA